MFKLFNIDIIKVITNIFDFENFIFITPQNHGYVVVISIYYSNK